MKADSFSTMLEDWPVERVRELLAQPTAADVRAALAGTSQQPSRLAALLSCEASALLEEMAQHSTALTRRRFGYVLQFYAPLYVSNHCCNGCRYCGFNRSSPIHRRALTLEEALAEADFLAETGFRHVLLVSGEDPAHVPLEYFEELTRCLSDRFASISVEIYPLDGPGYRRLVEAGVDGLALYQETYDPCVYRDVHPTGPKRDFVRRLQAMEDGAVAGMQALGIGALLGLNDWREDMFYTGMHALFLQRRFWRSHVSISFPRMRQAPGGIAPYRCVTDRDLVQMICAMRLFLPDAGLVLSTREPARLRDHLLPLGITRLSAASVTEPGGYTGAKPSGAQFEVHDRRSLRRMAEAVRAGGFDPVFKDWDASYR